MQPDHDHPQPPAPDSTLSVRLGTDGTTYLERCRQLLRSRDPAGRTLSRGTIIRAALRRLLLAELALLYNPDQPDHPLTREYHAVVEAEIVERWDSYHSQAAGQAQLLPAERPPASDTPAEGEQS